MHMYTFVYSNMHVYIPQVAYLRLIYRKRTQGSGIKMRKTKIRRYNLCYLVIKKIFSNLPNVTW